MKPWAGQVSVSVFLVVSFRERPSPRAGAVHGTKRPLDPGVEPGPAPPHVDPNREDRTRLSEVTDAPFGSCVRPHLSDPPRRPFVRPRSATPRCHSPRPSFELTWTGPSWTIDCSLHQ